MTLLARPLNGEAFSGSTAERRLFSQEDYSLSVGGLACDPSLLRTTLSRAAVSGFRGSAADFPPPNPRTQPARHLPVALEPSHGGAAGSRSGQKLPGREAPGGSLAQLGGSWGSLTGREESGDGAGWDSTGQQHREDSSSPLLPCRARVEMALGGARSRSVPFSVPPVLVCRMETPQGAVRWCPLGASKSNNASQAPVN